MGLVLGTCDTGAPSWSDSSCGRGGRGVTSTFESGSMAVPAAEPPAEPEQPEQQEQELGSAADTECHSDVTESGRPRRILVASLGTGMGTTTIAALLGSVLATTRAGTVRALDATALDATPRAGRLAARLLPLLASEHDGLPARLEVRTVDPAAVCATEETAGEDVTVVDLGTELPAAARSGLLGWADRLVFVRSDSGEADPGQTIPGAIPVGALIAAGHNALAQHAVTVRVAHDPPAPPIMPPAPAPRLSVDGHGLAVVRIPFDAHLSTADVLDLDRLSPATATAARQLATLVTGSSRPDLESSAPASNPPPPSPSSSGLPGGLSVPALVIDTGARSQQQAGVASPAGSGPGNSPTPRPVRRVVVYRMVVCTVVAVLALLAWWATLGSGRGAPVGCAAGDRLPAHDGHPTGAVACVDTPFGEQAAQNNSPTLLIVGAPSTVRPGDDIALQISVRNLVRDDFPPASHGGYLAKPASLDTHGLTRGHVHSACRALASGQQAPPPDRVTAFAAIEDGAGGAEPDTVEVHLPGRDAQGAVLFPAGSLVQCAAWAGDGSHRIPMGAWPDQVPAFDAVRITVTG